MTPERQRIAEEIFKEARARPAEDRKLFVESRCGADTQLINEVQSLLTWFDNESGMLDNTPPLLDGITEADAAAALIPAGGKVGPYRILSVLGVGGMGVVYLAEQQRPQRTVALKVIRPGLASPSVLRRLAYEAELLGRLQHPGIAHVIEAGTADAGFGLQPFFAMELVKGQPLNIYCAEKKLGTRDRLGLMELVCDAVEHAHRRGVIHRDLKPANILVDESGQPKILDFGVARATGSKDGDQRLTMLRTGERQLIGTLAYMSPEQVGGDPALVDFRSDVYALGVILYELLAGQPPHDISNKALPDAMRVIRDQDAKPLRTLNTSYRGDLDTIAAKALEKDQTRRYQSAAELGADIRRSLSNLPIAARPASALYQITKFTHRNKALVIGTSIALAALVSGLVVSTVQYTRASRAATRSEEVARLLKGMIGGINPKVAQARDTSLLKEIVDNTAKTVGNSLQGQPTVEAELRSVIGDVYFSIGEYPQAEEQFRAAHTLYEKAVGRKSAEYSDNSIKLMNVLVSTDRYDEAIKVSEEAIATRSAVFGPSSEEAAEAYACLGESLKRSDIPAAISNLEKATAMYERSSGPSSLAVARTLEHLGSTCIEGGRPEEAEKALRRSFEIRNKELGPGNMDTVNVAGLLGNVYVMKQRYAEAEPFCRVYAEQMAKLMPKEHAATPLAWASLAHAVQKQGRLGEAIELYQAQIEPLTKILGRDDLNVGTFHNNLGSVLIDAGEFDAAEPEYTEALRVYRAAIAKSAAGGGTENLRVPFSLLGLANVCWGRGEYAKSEEFARQAYEVGVRVLPEKHAAIGASALRLAACEIELANLNDPTPAIPITPTPTPTATQAEGPTSPAARVTQAVALAEKAIADFTATMGEDHFNVWQARARLGAAHATQAAIQSTVHDKAAAEQFARAEKELLLVQNTLATRADLGAFPARETCQYDMARVLARMYKAWDAIEPGTGRQELAEESAAKAAQINSDIAARRAAMLSSRAQSTTPSK